MDFERSCDLQPTPDVVSRQHVNPLQEMNLQGSMFALIRHHQHHLQIEQLWNDPAN